MKSLQTVAETDDIIVVSTSKSPGRHEKLVKTCVSKLQVIILTNWLPKTGAVCISFWR